MGYHLPIFFIAVMSIIVLPFYSYMVYNLSLKIHRQKVRGQYFRAVISIVEDIENDEEIIYRINLDFKKLLEKYPRYIGNMFISLDLLEEMIFQLDEMGIEKFSSYYGVKISNESKNKIINIAKKIREQNPFISLSPKAANFLITLKNSIESGNKELSYTTLEQLSGDIEATESSVASQKKQTNLAIIISIVSVLLTFLFGILSFVKY
ncbi:MAG: hypothetical protein M1576_04215 [Deltaproteobacteria bacterium]|jgi:hypothetical protein|nr:hypothetical protein [Deltaproteobacteria bacterium]